MKTKLSVLIVAIFFVFKAFSQTGTLNSTMPSTPGSTITPGSNSTLNKTPGALNSSTTPGTNGTLNNGGLNNSTVTPNGTINGSISPAPNGVNNRSIPGTNGTLNNGTTIPGTNNSTNILNQTDSTKH